MSVETEKKTGFRLIAGERYKVGNRVGDETYNPTYVFLDNDETHPSAAAMVYGIPHHITLEEATSDPRSAEGLARAYLFAAAPELLEALQAIANFPCNCAPDKQPGDECESCIARTAIAKAEGRTE